MNNRKGLLALSPLFVFVTIYLVASIIAQDFYKVPISVAFVIASIYAVAISYKNSFKHTRPSTTAIAFLSIQGFLRKEHKRNKSVLYRNGKCSLCNRKNKY